MSRKALFFDVDGTLINQLNGGVPESATAAIAAARRNGHLVFINSGRTYGYIGPVKGMVEADGYLCGCGTYVVAEGEVLYSHRIPHERGVQIKKDILRYGCDGVLESLESCYFRKEKSWIPVVEEIREAVKHSGQESPYSWEEDCYEYDKFCVLTDENSDWEGLLKTLEPDIKAIDRGKGFYECVPAGHSKATAIEIVLKHYGIPLEDAYVFGDSTNDLPMFEYAKNCILMADHDKELEPYATFVTKSVEEDGIAYAMKELGLI